MAPDRVLALHYARELYGRRQESVRLWVVRRDDIAVLEDPDLLQPPLDRSFKKPGGYVMRDKLRGRARAVGAGEAAARSRRRRRRRAGQATTTSARRPRPGDPRRASALLLLSMADDELVLGFSDSEWTGIAPLLEEDVAMSSLAQDELGHAQALYRLLADLVDDGRDADAIAYDRPAEGYYHARLLDHPRGDWATAIARRYLYDTADAVRLEALADASYAPLRDLVGKIRREERYHVLHAEAWLERLATGDVESRERLLGGDGAPGPDAWTVLTPLPNDRSLVDGRRAGRLAGRARRALAGGDLADARTGSACRRRGPAGDPGTRPDGPLRRVPLAPRRASQRPPPRSGGDLVTAAVRPRRSRPGAANGRRARRRGGRRRPARGRGPRDPGDLRGRPRA